MARWYYSMLETLHRMTEALPRDKYGLCIEAIGLRTPDHAFQHEGSEQKQPGIFSAIRRWKREPLMVSGSADWFVS